MNSQQDYPATAANSYGLESGSAPASRLRLQIGGLAASQGAAREVRTALRSEVLRQGLPHLHQRLEISEFHPRHAIDPSAAIPFATSCHRGSNCPILTCYAEDSHGAADCLTKNQLGRP